MKIKYVALALFPFALTACQTAQQVTDAIVIQPEEVATTQSLTQYNWTYQASKASKPLILHFDKKQRLNIQTGCNTQGGTWKVIDNTLVTSSLMSTMMACSNDLMQQERFSADLLSKKKVAFKIDTTQDQAVLTLTDTKGQQYLFTGTLTPEAKYQSEGQTVFLEIAPETKSCIGIAPQNCMQVREVKYNEKGVRTYTDPNWSLYYGQIKGFQHQNNQRVIVRVKRYPVKNPAADQANQVDILDMVVEQELIK